MCIIASNNNRLNTVFDRKKVCMTFKEEVEFLCGKPVEVFNGDPMTIPCSETSNAAKLCKAPLVSVRMPTYNQEEYIRQAIESVMMQKTDFEFEVLIGDDCSTDRTREICFECQKKYPDKIRVLWSDENLFKYHGNQLRILARCRGEYIAICEGDDYWSDPLKLQKQVDLIRKTGAVMCVADSEWHYKDGAVEKFVYGGSKRLLDFEDLLEGLYFHTTTYLIDRAVYAQCKRKYPEIVFWYDRATLLLMSTMGKICVLPDVVSVYRVGNGVSGLANNNSRAFATMIAVQQLQFEQCSNDKISRYYGDKAIKHLVKHIVLARDSRMWQFPEDVRSRALRLARMLCRKRHGRLQELGLRFRVWRKTISANH